MFASGRGSRTGKVYKHSTLTWYALEGCIVLRDESDSTHDVLSLPTWCERMEKLKEILKSIKTGETPIWMLSERDHEMQLRLSKMEQAAREAADMGDPCDPRVQAYNRRHYRPTTTSSVSMRTKALRESSNAYPELGPLPLGKDTGKTVNPTQLQKSLLLPHVHVPARKKDRAGTVLLSR